MSDGRSPWMLRAYGSSDSSMEDARRRAQEISERAAAAVARGQPRGDYEYSDRPLREEIVDESDYAGERVGVVTRNSYGSLVLNTSRVMFIDVDYPEDRRRSTGGGDLGAWLGRLWARFAAKPAVPPATSPDQELLERFSQVTRATPGLGLRVYRTAGGFRLLVTSDTSDPASAQAEERLEAFGSDALYMRLCKTQECFRARLTAKFWRCGASKPPSRYPWTDAAHESKYRQWEQEYHLRANQFATCAYVSSFGEPAVHDEVQPILDVHERLTRNGDAPLA